MRTSDTKRIYGRQASAWASLCGEVRSCMQKIRDERGQGTTEYAILVGVLVVIAIVAIVAFRGKISELWQAISDGINSL